MVSVPTRRVAEKGREGERERGRERGREGGREREREGGERQLQRRDRCIRVVLIEGSCTSMRQSFSKLTHSFSHVCVCVRACVRACVRGHVSDLGHRPTLSPCIC